MYGKTKSSSSLLQNKESIAIIAVLFIAAAGVGVYAAGSDLSSPLESEDTNDGAQLEGFDVMANIGGLSFDTSSGDVSAVGVNISSATLTTQDQTGDESVEYNMTVQQDSASINSGGGSVPTNFGGNTEVTVSGSQSASQAGSETYGSGVATDLDISLSDSEAGTLATDVSVSSNQSVDFNFLTDATAEIKDNQGNVVDSSSTSQGNPTLTVSDITASIDTFTVTGQLDAQE